MDIKEEISSINSSLIRRFIDHHLSNVDKDFQDIRNIIDSYAYPFNLFMGTAVKNYGDKALRGTFFLLSLLSYYESQKKSEEKWLMLTLAFMDEDFCKQESLDLIKDSKSYIDESVRLVADNCPVLIFYLQPFFKKMGPEFEIGFFSAIELIRRSIEHDLDGNNKAVKH